MGKCPGWGAYVLHLHSRNVDRGIISPFSHLFSPFSHPSSPFSHPLFPFSLPCLGLRFGLSLSEQQNWSLPKSAKISVGWSLPYTDQGKVSRNIIVYNFYN